MAERGPWTFPSSALPDTTAEILRLRLIAGHNLIKKDVGLFKKSDPYIRIDLYSIGGKLLREKVYIRYIRNFLCIFYDIINECPLAKQKRIL